MSIKSRLQYLGESREQSKAELVIEIRDVLCADGFDIEELDDNKPWGAYFRIPNLQASEFITTFFPELSLEEARLGISGAELSPKILLVSPKQRLSWQYHNRRAERWVFLTSGSYTRSKNDDQGDIISVQAGHVVQFENGERHRLVGADEHYVVVAEIWQHTDTSDPSDELDIIRLSDDYQR